LLFVALEQRSAEMPLALSFIGGTQRHERRLAFTLSETIVMTRLASGPRQSVEALSFLRSSNDATPLPAALVFRRLGSLLYDRNLGSHL
jgi:hypothetical protein